MEIPVLQSLLLGALACKLGPGKIVTSSARFSQALKTNKRHFCKDVLETIYFLFQARFLFASGRDRGEAGHADENETGNDKHGADQPVHRFLCVSLPPL